ncbi:MAG: ABC transporter substrate-binding protein [Chloroflexi bacterium]|nr:ABC transporter substrate-binding protein [Chloroflexota bacterium]
MRRLANHAIVLIATLSLLAACAPAAAPAPPTPAPALKPASSPVSQPPTPTPQPPALAPTPKPAASEPRYGGVLKRTLGRDVPAYDIQMEQGGDPASVFFNVYQGLVRLHPLDHQKIVGELAQSWEISPDGKTYTFKFHPGIKWHDGRPFTPDDARYSLERMHDPKAFKTISPRGQGLLAAMDKAEVAGDDSLKVTTKYPSASFLRNIATGWVAIEPKHILTVKGDVRKDPVGTGPFKFRQHNTDVSLEVVKNPDYYIKGAPYLDGIKWFIIKDSASRFSAFRTGAVDVTFTGATGLQPQQADIAKRDMADKATIYEQDSLSRYSILFNLSKKPWNDVRVRKAIHLAWDRQAAIRINGSRGYIATLYSAYWSMKPEALEKLPGYRQPKDADIAEAKRLLAEAGYGAGIKAILQHRIGALTDAQAVFSKDQLAKIGINVDLLSLELTTQFERMERRQFDDLVSHFFVENTGDPDETLNTFYVTGGSANFGNYSDKALDELITRQSATLDVEARKRILAEIETKVLEQVPMFVSFFDVLQTGVWKRVRNYRPGPGVHPWNKFDMAWLAE